MNQATEYAQCAILAYAKYGVNTCTSCLNDTSYGSGRFVNRVPSDTNEIDGYMCEECQQEPCIRCAEPTTDYVYVDHLLVCPDCLTVAEMKSIYDWENVL